ncbi:MAG: GYF domain-containing protein [Muribaculaceae bacterium]
MKFFVAINGQQQGPFEIEELRSYNLTKQTLVWTEGMPEWRPAGDVPELATLFGAPQPPFQQQPFNPYQQQTNPWGNNQQPMPPQPKTWLVESILVTVFCCMIFGIIGIINAANVSSLYSQGRYQESVDASEKAGKWCKLGFYIGIAVIILYIIFYAVLFSIGMDF